MLSRLGRFVFELLQCQLGFFQRQIGTVNDFVGTFDRSDLLRRETTTLEAFAINAGRHRAIARSRHKRRHVLTDSSRKGSHGVRTDMAKLMHRGEATQEYPVAQMHVPRQGCIIGQDDIVAELAIMGDVHISHDPIIVTDACHAGILGCAQIEGNKFADGIAVTDFQPGWLTSVFFVLRGST